MCFLHDTRVLRIKPLCLIYGGHITNEYRGVCLALEKVLRVPAEDLFPKNLYDHLVDVETEKVIEVSSFAALTRAVKKEIQLLPAPAEESPEIKVGRIELIERVHEVFKLLSSHEREIIRLLYGIPDGYTHTVEEVAEIFHVSHSRIRQLEARSLRKLQQLSRSQNLVSFL